MMDVPSLVMLTERPDGLSAVVLDSDDFGERTLEDLTVDQQGMLGAFGEHLSRCSTARCALLGEAGSLSPDLLSAHGNLLATAWAYAFSPYHARARRAGICTPRLQGWVADLDREECLWVDRSASTVLPYLLYVGPRSVCDHPLAGRWAFDSLCWALSDPVSDEGFRDVLWSL